jgi:hypothetical protein
VNQLETLVITEGETGEDYGVTVYMYLMVTIAFKRVKAAQLAVFYPLLGAY